MRRLWNWAREIEWLAVAAVLLVLLAITLGVVSVWLPAVTGLAIVLAFSALSLASLSK